MSREWRGRDEELQRQQEIRGTIEISVSHFVTGVLDNPGILSNRRGQLLAGHLVESAFKGLGFLNC